MIRGIFLTFYHSWKDVVTVKNLDWFPFLCNITLEKRSDVLLRAAFFYTGPVTAWKTAAQGNPLWNTDRYREHENRLQLDFVLKF